ncbi:MAG: DUF2281 domain-containing protein [Pyrinomonadaceae bacterium]
MQNAGLIEKIQNLPPETISEVEDFVDFLTEKKNRHNSANGSVNLRERGISEEEAAEQRAMLSSFAEDWENPEMEVYDKL